MRIVLYSYLLVITIGTILLALPYARLIDIPFIDLLFTASSCTCVTGLTPVPISCFTTFGKCVLLGLMQLGGLGLLTLSLFFASLFLNLGMATKMIAGEVFEFKWSRIRTFILTIVTTTFLLELTAAIYFFFSFRKLLPTKQALFHAIFHSVSAFCNTGLTLFEDGILPFKNDIPFLVITAFLVFAGSVGFLVWFALADKIKKGKTFSLHTRIVLWTTAGIVLFGTVITWLLEQYNTLQNVSFSKGLFYSFFNTISLRSAGFELFNVNHIMPATLLIFIILMYIGGSPGSIAGGIKTTTFAVFLATMATIVRNRDEVEIFGRQIPQDQVYKAISIIVLTATWILSTTFILLIIEPGFNFIQIFLEVVSTFSLCGLETKIIASFSAIGKIFIIITMLIGRIGSLSLLFALRKKKKKLLYRYPEEQIIIG